MTQQRLDSIEYDGHCFELASEYGTGAFRPEDFDVHPQDVITNCHKGYLAHFVVHNNTLLLMNFSGSTLEKDHGRPVPFTRFVPIADTRENNDVTRKRIRMVEKTITETIISKIPPPINGVSPEMNDEYDFEYKNLNIKIPFTGVLVLVDDFIPELRSDYGGYPSPLSFKRNIAICFDSGILIEARDISTMIEDRRTKLIEDGSFENTPHDYVATVAVELFTSPVAHSIAKRVIIRDSKPKGKQNQCPEQSIPTVQMQSALKKHISSDNVLNHSNIAVNIAKPLKECIPFYFYIIHILPAAFLFAALWDEWPYGYYIVLRLVVTVGALFAILFDNIETIINKRVMTTIWILIAIIFNPFIMVHLDKDTWAPIDIVCGSIFGLRFTISILYSLPWKRIIHGLAVGLKRLFQFVILPSFILAISYYSINMIIKKKAKNPTNTVLSQPLPPILSANKVANLFASRVNVESMPYKVIESNIIQGRFTGNYQYEALVNIKDTTPENLNYHCQLWLMQYTNDWQPVMQIAHGFLLNYDKIDVDADGLYEVSIYSLNEIADEMVLKGQDMLLGITKDYQERSLFNTQTTIPHYSTGRGIKLSSPLYSDINNDSLIEVINFIDSAGFNFSSFWRLVNENGIRSYKRISICAGKDSAINDLLNRPHDIDASAGFIKIGAIADSLNDAGAKEEAIYYYAQLDSLAKNDKEKARSLGSLAQICNDLDFTISSQKYCKAFLLKYPKSNWAKLLVENNLAKYQPFTLELE